MPFPLENFTRQSIEDHFKHKNLRWAEDYFIAMLGSSDKYDVYWAAVALRDCGTAKCVPVLKDKLDHPMRDLKAAALLTVAHISGSQETPFYAETLLSPKYPEKAYAMWAIAEAADDRALESALEYFSRNKSKIQKGQLPEGILVHGAKYLAKYHEQNARVAEFFQFLASSWPKLPEAERAQLKKGVKYFANLK